MIDGYAQQLADEIVGLPDQMHVSDAISF